MKKFLLTCFILLLLLAAAVGVGYYWFLGKSEVQKGTVQIAEGTTVKQTAELLAQQGLIEDADIFYYYIRLKQEYFKKFKDDPDGYPVVIKSGTFDIEQGDFESLVKALNEGKGQQKPSKTVTFPEGITVEEIANILEKNEIFLAEKFMGLVQDEKFYKGLRTKYTWLPEIHEDRKILLEGFMHPNTYDIPLDVTMDVVIKMMLDETNVIYEREKENIEQQDLPFFKLITLASVVERESKFKTDRPKVAQVFLNRMEKGMKLESDITAAYANGEHKVFMYYKDVATKSKYNTYYVKGLPIGPIASPSEDAIMSVLHPEGKDFKALYFYARPSGETFYATTLEGHKKNQQKYEHEWKELEKQQSKK